MEDLFEDVETDGFSIVWAIQNFSYCVQKLGEKLESPTFALDTHGIKEFSLILYPRGYTDPDTFGYYLKRYNKYEEKIVTFALSIRTAKGSFIATEDTKVTFRTYKVKEEQVWGWPSFLRQRELCKKGADACLVDDVLTVRCRITKVNDELVKSSQCHARTIIGVERTTFIWSLKDFGENLSETKLQQPISTNKPAFIVDVFLSRGTFEEKLQIEIQQTDTDKRYFTTCVMSLLMDADGKIAHYVRDEHFFEVMKGKQVWKFTSIPDSKLLNLEKLFPNGTHYLRCEFAVSLGVQYSNVESTRYGIAEDRPLCVSSQKEDSHFSGSLKDNLLRFYSEGRHSDFTIKTTNMKFPVHKAILCARSEVFGAMFERDMKENRSGVLEIEDMDEDTISRMLMFIYTDAAEDLDWEAASELYAAADKYGIEALKRKCSYFLRGNINTSNACGLLALSDMHQDRELKSATQDFICEHVTEIHAGEWDRFMQDKSDLASEIMRLVFVKNLKA